MRRLMATVGVGLTMLGGATMSARQAAPGPLVSTAWVAERLNDPSLVIIHVGPAAAYPATHLPGARVVNTTAIGPSAPGANGATLSLQMPDAEALRAALESHGVSDGSRVVVYAATPPWTAFATRVILTLQYAGLGDRAHLMQGGLAEWVAEARPTTDVVPPAASGKLSPLKIVPLIVDADVVDAQRKASGVRVVDARAQSYYDGVQTGGSQTDPHKTGHIEGAVNVPFNSTYDAQGRFKSADELRAVFATAGVKPGETVLAYCHIGQQATATIFAARLAGFDVKLYDGSFEDWSKRPNAAVVTTIKK